MALSQLGIVVHPRREIDDALGEIRDWGAEHGVALGQVRIAGQERRAADPVEVSACDLVIALGGDGTTLAALHAAAPVSRPVLGVACGSIGVLTSVPATRVNWALDQVGADRWTPKPLPGLRIEFESGQRYSAINDFAVIRDGTGQVITGIEVDGELYARTAGDGLIVATPLGSSAYTMAAGGPILAPGAQGMVVTPLAHHGGVAPPLVVAPDSRLRLSAEPGYGGCRFEFDGQEVPMRAAEVTVTVSLARDYATMVELAEEEPVLSGLRRRGLLVDAPRILVRERRSITPRIE
jgi:NAD+ kinase